MAVDPYHAGSTVSQEAFHLGCPLGVRGAAEAEAAGEQASPVFARATFFPGETGSPKILKRIFIALADQAKTQLDTFPNNNLEQLTGSHWQIATGNWLAVNRDTVGEPWGVG